MSKMILEISDELAEALRVPAGEKLGRLRWELAVRLYQKGLLSFGKARELAQMNKWEFHVLLGEEGIVRRYDLEELEADYEEVISALAPMTDKDAIARIVAIAEESGIDIDPDADKLRVPSVTISQAAAGGGTYQVLSLKNIMVQGDHDSVMAFISDLDSGKTLETMVLTSVATIEVAVMYEGEEADRRTEFRAVISAVKRMMVDNTLSEIPNPMSFDGGAASSNMTAFPDSTSQWTGTPRGKTEDPDGVDYEDGDRAGYLLYGHDMIADSSTTDLVDYILVLITKYYYTCEADGTVRQFDGADVATATEYLGSEQSKPETVATVSVDIYVKLAE